MTTNFENTRKVMKEMVLQAKTISSDEFRKILVQHEKFMESGGAGGRWETFYIENLIFGAYRGASGSDGKQAKLGFHNLQEIDLQGISLSYSDCAAIHCIEKSWENADLEGCLFIDSILNQCSFTQADLYAADFSRSELRNCNFQRASLIRTDFEDCDLSGSDFRGAQIDDSTLFKNAIMQDVLMDK